MAIEFTQFLRPDGRRQKIHMDCSLEIQRKADAIKACGYRFEAEVLMDGTVSVTVSDEEQDLFIELVRNGPAVPLAVQKLVNAAHERLVPK